ncbi:UNVERIFIED_CONTAM: hypothetical protein K2H54_005749 [Gekko kuhli]
MAAAEDRDEEEVDENTPIGELTIEQFLKLLTKGIQESVQRGSEYQRSTQPPSPDSEDSAFLERPIRDGNPETPMDDDCDLGEPMQNHDRDPEHELG